MKFCSIHDLRNETTNVCETVRQEGEVVVMDNDKPTFLMLTVADDSFETILRAIRQAKATIAFNNMRAVAAENGYMTDEEIEAEISESRKERRLRRNS